MIKDESTIQLDQEWVELILLAKKIGLTQKEIRAFLQNHARPLKE